MNSNFRRVENIWWIATKDIWAHFTTWLTGTTSAWEDTPATREIEHQLLQCDPKWVDDKWVHFDTCEWPGRHA